MPTPVPRQAQTQTLLQAVPFFSPLGENTLAGVAAEVIARRYQAGEIIFLEGEPNAGLHLVAEGECKVYRLSGQGREQVLINLGPGDSCNEVPAVDDGPNPASLAAVTEATVWIIPGRSLDRLRARYPDLNEAVIKNLALRCRQLVQRVYNLSFLSVTGRLAAFLLQHCDQASTLNRRQWTQDEIAAHLGTVREMVGRGLRELQQAELIAINRHQIEILDQKGLVELT